MISAVLTQTKFPCIHYDLQLSLLIPHFRNTTYYPFNQKKKSFDEKRLSFNLFYKQVLTKLRGTNKQWEITSSNLVFLPKK